MMAGKHVFTAPERFVAGTVGQPGERTFYLQASEAGRMITVSLEKAEVAALAHGMTTLLAQVSAAGTEAAKAAPAGVDAAPLETPFLEDFRVSELQIEWDGDAVVVDAGDGEEGGIRVRLSVPQARAFVQRAESLVAAGRPPCVLCGRPDGPTGHFCPRLN